MRHISIGLFFMCGSLAFGALACGGSATGSATGTAGTTGAGGGATTGAGVWGTMPRTTASCFGLGRSPSAWGAP
jgi:hypothetical protein